MSATPERRRVQQSLARCAKDIAEHAGALADLYAERNALYVEGLDLGMSKVQLAAWAGSSADAVAKALAKLDAS